jgi:hypothetical protein
MLFFFFFFAGPVHSAQPSMPTTLNFFSCELASPTELSPLRFNTHTCKKNAGKLFKLESALAPTVRLHIPKSPSYLLSASPKTLYSTLYLHCLHSTYHPLQTPHSHPQLGAVCFFFLSLFFFFKLWPPVYAIAHLFSRTLLTSRMYSFYNCLSLS